MIRTIFLLAFCFLMAGSCFAQRRLPGNSNIYGSTGKGLVYDNEMTFNMSLASPRNFLIGMRSGKLVSFDEMRYWSLSFGDLRNSRELRENPDRINLLTNRVSRAYVFGKQNQLYVLRLGFGKRKYLSEKARQRGVAVGYSYEFGPTLGFLKPYYLEVDSGEPNSNRIIDIRHTGINTAEFLNQDRIFGASAWTQGIDEISIRPGIHAKIATHFAFGAYDEMAKSLEVGISADYLLGNTDILIESELTPGVSNTPLHLNLFINIQLGKRW